MTTPLEKFILKVAPFVVAYGVGRKLLLLNGATIEQRQENPETGRVEYKPVPLLHTQKAMIATLSGVTATGLFPYYMYEDIKRCERCIRGIPEGKPWFPRTHIIDYVFM